MNNTASPVSASGRPGVGLANIVRAGGPLSRLLKDTTAAVEVNPDCFKDTTPQATKSVARDLLINDPELSIEPDDIINQDVNRKIDTVKEEKVEQHQSRPSLSSSSDPKPPITSDPDSDDNWDRKFLKRVMDQRAQNIHELQLIENGKRDLEEEREQIELMKQSVKQQINDLKVRETKVAEVELLIPLARQLQMMKVDVRNFIPWTEMVQGYAMNHNTDLTTAAFDIVKILRAFENLETVENIIKQAEQKLSALGQVIRENQRAITTLVDLHKMGYTKKNIKDLTALVTIWNQGDGISGSFSRKLDDELINVGGPKNNGKGNLQQPGSSNPALDSSPSLVNGNRNNGNFSMNDWIRLNLLKGATSNMLNRVGWEPNIKI